MYIQKKLVIGLFFLVLKPIKKVITYYQLSTFCHCNVIIILNMIQLYYIYCVNLIV
ncbi:hypothetical protein C1645_776328 [Glomus cerebriforme]|uniref:Uncharacterized protein n=1 Tax=Glomus cerebriforme TaxID=658196 RepID=A0A397SQ92_9GLOM|nr:hypothetical protein C1645_776328 [Glomus cerebriforme]